MIELNFFGITKDIVGQNKLKWPQNEAIAVQDLMQELFKKHEALAHISSILVAVNEEYASPGSLVQPGDIVALIPPVSGG
jgi:molybdopterin converting factor subunit 1